MGGNLIDFPGDKSTRTADLTTIKTLADNIISTLGAQAVCMDVKDFFLKSTLPDHEYFQFKIDIIPKERREQYNLQEYADADGYLYAHLEKGMYGLPQAGKIANDQLLPRLATGYTETGITLASTNTNPTPSSLPSSLMTSSFNIPTLTTSTTFPTPLRKIMISP